MDVNVVNVLLKNEFYIVAVVVVTDRSYCTFKIKEIRWSWKCPNSRVKIHVLKKLKLFLSSYGFIFLFDFNCTVYRPEMVLY